MMKNKWKAKVAWLASVTALIALMAAPAWATSYRFFPEAGYDAQVYMMDQGADYQGSMDIVYADVSTGDWKTRCIMKVESGSFNYYGNDYNIRVMLYDYTGKAVKPLAVLDVPFSCWGQGVKLDANTNTIWFSYTIYVVPPLEPDDRWYSFTWDDTLAAYSGGPLVIDYAGDHYQMNCNWEMEISTDPDLLEGDTGQGGRPFFCGLNSSDWADPHSVWVRNGDNWQKVVEIGGSSCGFAFDNMGNLWHGAYHFYTQDPNCVFMWTALQIDTASRAGTVLNAGDATAMVNLPVVQGHKAGANDVECDPNGNVYVSANGGWSKPPLPPIPIADMS